MSDLLHLDPGTLSPLVKRLAKAGLVTRERDPRDERNLALTLTAQGRALRRRAEKVPGEIVRRLDVPIEQLEHARLVVTDLLAAADRASSDPA